MLVVITLLAALISLLLPALGAARREARRTLCLASLRQYGMANDVYAIGSQNWYVPVHVPNPADLGNTVLAWIGNQRYRELLGVPKTGKWTAGIICPDARLALEGGLNKVAHSYGFNRDGIAWSYLVPAAIRRSRVRSPALRMQMDDATDWHVNRSRADYLAWWDVWGEYYGWPNPPLVTAMTAYRHVEGANYVCFDGHADYRKKENMAYDIPLWDWDG